jgi:DNA mismatch endonuclease, patch repair protein
VRRATPSYEGLSPASLIASRIAIAASAKRDTRPELMLRRALRGKGLRYRLNVTSLLGRPDLVIPAARLAVFCDGDFWHGRHLRRRLQKLAGGHNSAYWVAKIKSNVARDRRINRGLEASGWTVVRLWESDVRADPDRAAETILKVAHNRRRRA